MGLRKKFPRFKIIQLVLKLVIFGLSIIQVGQSDIPSFILPDFIQLSSVPGTPEFFHYCFNQSPSSSTILSFLCCFRAQIYFSISQASDI